MKTRLFSLLLVAMLCVVCFIACQKKSETVTPQKATTTPTVEQSTSTVQGSTSTSTMP